MLLIPYYNTIVGLMVVPPVLLLGELVCAEGNDRQA